jgi:plastocyanin
VRRPPGTDPAFAILALAAFVVHETFAATVSGQVRTTDGQGIAGAVVFVDAPAPSETATAPPRAEMNQVNKTFVPAVLPIVAGTRVYFPNSDQIQHHVYSFSRTKSFELPLYRGEEATPVLFDKPGVVKLGCNIHDWMSAIILVLPSPQFAMTDADGRYSIRDLPPGDYSLVAWHELGRDKTEDVKRAVKVTAAGAVADFELSLTDARKRPARHGVRSEP